jgi:hypothetical protein
MLTIKQVAEMCHETNRVYCRMLEDDSQRAWDDAPEWARSSAINGVNFHMDTPDASPSASHNCWLRQKEAEGWKYGPVKNPELKQHPCFVPFEQLPKEQQAKDHLFKSVVNAVRELVER